MIPNVPISISSQALTINPIVSQSLRYLQLSPSISASVTNRGTIVITDSHPTAPLSLLFNSSSIIGFINKETYLLGNSLYFVSPTAPALIDNIYNSTGNLFVYGRVYTFLMFVAFILFLGKQVNYKVDNYMITFSLIFITLPSLNLILDKGGLPYYSFLLGFGWSAHL